MAGFDPSQPRDEIGRWTKAGITAREAAGLSVDTKNEAEEELKSYLISVDKISGGNSVESYVLRHGRFCNPTPKPKEIKYGDVKECYSNATHLVWENPDKYTYFEGYAFPDFANIPIHHAWVVDRNNNVIDNTWKSVGAAYFGVPVKLEDLNNVLFESGTFGFLDFSKKSFRELVERDWLE